jgi:hypothetical protein
MNQQEEYIKSRMSAFALNIDQFSIGQTIIDFDGEICKIVNKTLNSIEVRINRKHREGIDANQWFVMNDFNKRFK